MNSPAPDILKWVYTHAIPALRYYAQHDPGGEASKALTVYPGTLPGGAQRTVTVTKRPTLRQRLAKFIGGKS